MFSDTHGNVSSLKNVFEWAKTKTPPNGTICAAAFLGDGINDLQKAADAAGFFCNWKYVSGNNDYDYSIPETAVFDFGDYRFLMCHGHRHSMYGGFHSLIAAAKNNQAQVVMFGHTHVPLKKTVEGIILVNPGSITRPRSRIGPTFATIESEAGEQLNVEFFGIGERGGIKKVEIKS